MVIFRRDESEKLPPSSYQLCFSLILLWIWGMIII